MRDSQDPVEIITATLSAAGFLSRLPMLALLQSLGERTPETDFARTARYFAPAGLIVALPAGLLALVLGTTSLDPFLVSAAAVAVLTATTGALHEDGLGDVADGFGGGGSSERKLEIMRDSTIGTYGAVTLILSLLIRVGALASLIGANRGFSFLLAFLGIAAVSRGAMVWIWAYLPAARSEGGLSRDHGTPGEDDARFAIIVAAAIGIVTLLPLFGVAGTLFALACGTIAAVGWAQFCRHQIGGHTGDVLGAGQQICEIALLLAGAIAI